MVSLCPQSGGGQRFAFAHPTRLNGVVIEFPRSENFLPQIPRNIVLHNEKYCQEKNEAKKNFSLSAFLERNCFLGFIQSGMITLI